MHVDVFLLPRDLSPDLLRNRAVVVFDVLRATTTMTVGLAAGVKEIRVFDSIESARVAAGQSPDGVLCGELHTVKAPGFDLGNSPGQFDPAVHGGKTLFMATTNGTRAIVAAREAKRLFIGAIVNASVVARQVLAAGLDVSLVCSGTEGSASLEDMLGAGAVIEAMNGLGEIELVNDAARMAHRLFLGCRKDLLAAMRDATGGRNILRVGLSADIEFAARLDVIAVVGLVSDHPLKINASPGD